MSDCIFCQIVAGKIPCEKLYEDERCLAFMDINPGNPGHCLVIPKAHHAQLHDLPDELCGPLLQATRTVARAVARGLKAEGYNVFQSNGRAAYQSVDHVHMHILPRWQSDRVVLPFVPQPADGEELKKTAETIRRAFD